MGELTVQVVGGKKVQRGLIRASQATDDELERAVRSTARQAVVIFGRVAPRRTGRLSRGIASRVAGQYAAITATARDPRTSYNYVGVTRFGHRVRRIYPKQAKALGPIPGIGFRRSVKGYRPKGDWVDRGLPAIALFARGALRGAGQRILEKV